MPLKTIKRRPTPTMKTCAFFPARFCTLFCLASLMLVSGLAQAQAQPQGEQRKSANEVLQLVKTYCGSCHAVPSPELLPKHSWPRVIDTMAELAEDRTGQKLIPEDALNDIKALYYGSSPEQLPVLPYIDQHHPEVRFSASRIGPGSSIPQILNVQAVDLGGDAQHSFLVSDGERKQLILLEARDDDGLKWQEQALADIDIPITTQVIDYNGDGHLDILVADLGEFAPNGILAGKIFLLQQDADGKFEKKLMMHRLGRVTDMQALDLDGDGDLDLAVSVFGGGEVGEVFWMERLEDGSHRKHELLDLSGALNITPVDLNGNGRMDLLTLVAQEHETLIGFINRGQGKFERMNIVSGGHPLFGATSMLVSDLDQDGDPDIVFTNGDAFDTQTDPKPYHGIQWLENLGDLKFAVHDISRFYGAANASVGDMDGDGDLDIVVSSWLNYWDDPKRQSIIWLENDGKQQFQARPVAGDHSGLVPLELVDITGNGRLDIVTGAFRMDILKEFLPGDNDRKAMNTEAMKDRQRPASDRLLLITNEQLGD